VVPYSIDQLVELIVENTPNNKEVVTSRSHHGYFKGYFDHIGAKTILAENEYVDRDYLEDYAGYYARCFEDYGRRCTRLHFFTIDFEEEDFEASLVEPDAGLTTETLSNGYLGFIVVRPLPTNPIGRTCLRSYPENNFRKYPVRRQYAVNLYGHDLTVNSLAFQEQDQVVAACATSALWTALHATGKLFHHTIPSPFDITEEASREASSDTRSMPNKGLTAHAMARAIRGFGLEPYTIRVSQDDFELKATVSAYLNCGIPPLLLIDLLEEVRPGEFEVFGKHAVAVTGFSAAKPSANPYGTTSFLSSSSRIDKLYVHDDGVGPFARMKFDSSVVNINTASGVIARPLLSTSWMGPKTKTIGTVFAMPEILMVPLYHKIRIAFKDIFDCVVEFDSIVSAMRVTLPLSYSDPLEWDVYLDTVSSLKSELLGKGFKDLITKSLPKYIWRATGSVSGDSKIQLLFDATDIGQGKNLIYVIEDDAELSALLRAVANLPDARSNWASWRSWNILRWFRPT